MVLSSTLIASPWMILRSISYYRQVKPWSISDGVISLQDLNQRLKPDKFTDIIALLALGRPGPGKRPETSLLTAGTPEGA